MPTHSVAEASELELAAQPIVLVHVAVVTRRTDQVQAHTITPPVRRALEARKEKAVEIGDHRPSVYQTSALGRIQRYLSRCVPIPRRLMEIPTAPILSAP